MSKDTPNCTFEPIFKAKLVEMANATAKTLTGDFKQVRQLVDENELVVAVWTEPQMPDGVATHVVRGRHLLQEIVATNSAQALTWAAIPCTCAEQAFALEQVCRSDRPELH